MDRVDDTTILHLWQVTSGWEGPFQYEDVLVVARKPEDARVAAERAFGAVTQPVCRARMRLFDLGAVEPGVLVGPRKGGTPLGSHAQEVGIRCDDPAVPTPATEPPDAP